MTQAGVTINHFLLQGDVSRRQELLHSLDQQTWPGEDDEKILIIQRLSVKGQWWEIGSNAAALAREFLAQAVHGSSANARTADVVFFHHTADQLACFCLAVLNRETATWFWKNLLPASVHAPDQNVNAASGTYAVTADHLTRLLLDYPLDIISIFTRILQQQKIMPLWNFLGADNIRKIFYRMAQASGWSVVSSTHSNEASFSLLTQSVKAHDLSDWKSSVLQLSETRLQQEVVNLLALLTAWQQTPYKLSNPNFCTAWLAITQSYFNNSQEIKDSDLSVISHAAVEKDKTPEPHLLITQDSSENSPGHADTKYNIDSENTAEQSQATIVNPEPHTQNNTSENGINYLTQAGGFFYLINALRMAGRIDAITLSGLSPWQWIWLIAKKMGCPADAGAQGFFCEQLNLSAVELNSLQYPDNFEQTEQQLQHRFGRCEFWNHSLFSLPARIETRDPYINVYFHMKNVNVDLRIAGLDIDPGWQPWLGQVIRFHYGHYPELARFNSDSTDQNKSSRPIGSSSNEH